MFWSSAVNKDRAEVLAFIVLAAAIMPSAGGARAQRIKTLSVPPPSVLFLSTWLKETGE
jgi:hypothetical protein